MPHSPNDTPFSAGQGCLAREVGTDRRVWVQQTEYDRGPSREAPQPPWRTLEDMPQIDGFPPREATQGEHSQDHTSIPQTQHRSTYAIGDLQGCFDDLLRLLDAIEFDPSVDRLWLTGDLVNRGPNSLALLRFVRSLGAAAITVLGNHDLKLLAAAAGAASLRKKDTIAEILAAPDCEELLFWLRHQPLLHHDPDLGFTMVHAGLPPQWDLETAHSCAHELEAVLQNHCYEDLFPNLGLRKPLRWDPDLEGWPRLRYIANCLTQMRWCDADGRLDLTGERVKAKGPKRSRPWFEIPGRAGRKLSILFGHWAALDHRRVKKRRIYPLDTGCSERGRFTALRLEDQRRFQLRCKNRKVPWKNG